jgi:RNA polymerase sigma factor (sigma-70 family)
MATDGLRQVIHTLRGTTLHHEEAGLTDGQLLERYLHGREEAALAALVSRHGPMVWGVCRRVLRSHHDAEDAFQATFLVLARKAASVVSRELVANWLYGVAHKTALKARATTARRGAREKQVTAMPEPAPERQDLWDDLQPLLDEELSRLPDKYRAVIALCDLQGKTRKEVARQLRVPEGTVASRLAAARALLARRLARHGLPVSGAALAAVLSQQAAAAGVPAAVASATIKAASLYAAGQAAAAGVISARAAQLAEGVLKTMLLTKLKIAMALLVLAAVAVLGVGAAALSQQGPAGKPADPPAAPPKALTAQPAAAAREAEPPPAVVNGVVKAVDAPNRRLTVAYGVGETTFSVAPDAKVEIDGKAAALAGLPAGANVRLSEFVDARTVRVLQANGRWYFGSPVTAVDPQGKTITISDRDGAKTITVAQDACISVDGKSCALAAVPKGALVNLGLAADQQTARSIGAEGPYLGGCGGSPVKLIDPVNHTLTFDDKAVAEVAGKTFVVSRTANIVIDGKPGKLAVLPTGSYVNVGLSVDQQTAIQVHAQGPPVDCDCGGSPVKAVDPVNHTITFADKARAEVAGKTFVVARDANITIDGRPGKLAELPAGALVSLRLRVDQATAGTLNANGSAFAGLIKAVDAANYTVTVDDATYPVAKDALVVIDGKQAPLASLPVGAGANVNLRVDLRTVGMIQTKAP